MDNFDLKKFIGDKTLLNENAPGFANRKMGEPLPTLESVKAAYEAKQDVEEGEGYKDYEDGVEKKKLAKDGELKEAMEFKTPGLQDTFEGLEKAVIAWRKAVQELGINYKTDKEFGDFETAYSKMVNAVESKDVRMNEEDTVDEMYGKKYEEDDIKSEEMNDPDGDRRAPLDNKDRMEEDARTDAEEEGYKDGMKDEKADMKKMKVSELKAKIRENILSELSEAEGDVDVDVDVEDEVEVEAGADDIEIERPGVKTTVSVGLSPEEEVVQDSLKAAMDAASQLGNDKLADQIGNTITFFTREYVVGNRDD